MDEFRERLRVSSMKTCFAEYSGSSRYEDALQYITEIFKKQYPPEKSFHYVTVCTIDTESVLEAWLKIMQLMKDEEDRQLEMETIQPQ